MRRLECVAGLLVMAMSAGNAAETAYGTSEPIPVDAREGELRLVAPGEVNYSAAWMSDVSAENYVVVETLEHGGMFNEKVVSSVTNRTAAGDSFADGILYVGTSGSPGCVRLVHRVFTKDGIEVGDPLVRDLAFGVSSAPGDGVYADCRTNSLQSVVDAGVTVALTYDTAWMPGASSVALMTVKGDGSGSVTNVLFESEADASGVKRMYGLGSGLWHVYCVFYDAYGDVLGAPMSAKCYRKPGLSMVVR